MRNKQKIKTLSPVDEASGPTTSYPELGSSRRLYFLGSLLASFIILFSQASMGSSALKEGVGLYVGSFDPPTMAHREIVLNAALKANLKNIYISVNRGGKHSSKDYRWSLGERISMVRSMLRDVSVRVVVLEQPIEGRVALAQYLTSLHEKPLRGIFGADTLEKDYEIFKVLPKFEYIAVGRPGYAIPTLPAGTVVHSMDSPGDISSTEVRKKLAQGTRDIPELYPAVEAFIYSDNPLDSTPPGEASRFEELYTAFQQGFSKLFPSLGIGTLAQPPFNPHQTLDGQKEKVIRAVLPLTDQDNQWAVLTAAQQMIETYHRTFPLHDARKAGFFLGSFDPVSKGQIDAINQAIEALELEVVYFSPLQKSRKPMVYPILDRMAALELVADRVKAPVRVLPSRTLFEGAEVVDWLNDKHSEGVTAVFGEPVFEDNFQRMSSIKGLEFAVFSFGNTPENPLPAGVTRIVTHSSITGTFTDVQQFLTGRSDNQPSQIAK